MGIFAYIKTSVLFGFIDCEQSVLWTEFWCFIAFMLPFSYMGVEFSNRLKSARKSNKAMSKMNKVFIEQAHSPLYYQGDIINGAKTLTKEIAKTLGADRCSIWLYNKDNTSIECEQLYELNKDAWSTDIVLHRKDFEAYFNALETDPIIIAEDALTHPATECFSEVYLKPLGIKSMLDVPIVYKGETIGVICTESLEQREWRECEVNFAQNISYLYAFAYSAYEVNFMTRRIKDSDEFISKASIISITDAKGRITYVNDKFEKVSGYKAEEVIGKNHKIVNSGQQPRSYWNKMYKKVLKGGVWHDVVANKAKDGSLYYVDTYIRARFDDEGKLEGFSSIRQDLTQIYNALQEVSNKNTYLEHAAKILRHDMHSGINTYIPRGISSLERRLKPEVIEELKLEAPLKMLKEGLKHTQKVYKGVYEFTNLVKQDVVLNTELLDLKKILKDYLESTSYSSQVIIGSLVEANVNESLFCTAIDNLIRNGLKYNDSDSKWVKVYMIDDHSLCIHDNGRGISQEDFDHLSKPYTRKKDQREAGSGLGLNICTAILKEHGFDISCRKADEGGTIMTIKLK